MPKPISEGPTTTMRLIYTFSGFSICWLLHKWRSRLYVSNLSIQLKC